MKSFFSLLDFLRKNSKKLPKYSDNLNPPIPGYTPAINLFLFESTFIQQHQKKDVFEIHNQNRGWARKKNQNA